MTDLAKGDLKYHYLWNAIGSDNPGVRGEPDNGQLNRQEGYEVIAFINRLASDSEWTSIGHSFKAERMLQEAPGNLRSRAHVRQWILDEWTSYK